MFTDLIETIAVITIAVIGLYGLYLMVEESNRLRRRNQELFNMNEELEEMVFGLQDQVAEWENSQSKYN